MSWNDVNSSKPQEGNKQEKVRYAKIPTGKTQGRILDEEPISRWKHWIPQANSGKGVGVVCIGKGCPVCAEIKADKAAKRTSKYNQSKSHAINFLNRTTGVVEILDKGKKIFSPLIEYKDSIGDLRNYDICIIKKGESFGEIDYTVIPVLPPVKLTAEELAMPKYDLAEIDPKLDAEQIKKLMGGANFEDVIKGAESATDTSSPIGEVSVDFTQAI